MATRLAILILLAALASVRLAEKPYRHLSFQEISARLGELSRNYPGLMRLESAQDRYQMPYPFCSPDPCPIFIVTLTDFASLGPERPQVFISGELHGDEILGPNVAVHLAKYMLENYGKDSWITYLLRNRVVVIMPAANSQGYYSGWREERTPDGKMLDPNRDFPYNNAPSECMNTLAGRAVARVVADHMFVLGVTFHGGDVAIGYEWGSMNHLKNSQHAEESPDDAAMSQLGHLLSKSAGEVKMHKIPKYPVDKMTDLVYAVKGGLEDWAYAASWTRGSETDQLVDCVSTSYGGFNSSELHIEPENVRFPLYLVETNYLKRPADSTFGSEQGIREPGSVHDGNIPRNIRLALAMIDMAIPYVRDIEAAPHNDSFISVSWKIGGALHVNETYIEWTMETRSSTPTKEASGNNTSVWTVNCERAPECALYNFTNRTKGQKGGSVWISPDAKFSAYLPRAESQNISYVFRVRALVDQQWARQDEPRPKLPPQTHFTRIRTEPAYHMEHKRKGYTISSAALHSSDVLRVSASLGTSDIERNTAPYQFLLLVLTLTVALMLILVICCYLIRRKRATWNMVRVQEVEMQSF